MLSHCCLTDLRKWLTKWAFIKWVIWLISSKLDFTTHVIFYKRDGQTSNSACPRISGWYKFFNQGSSFIETSQRAKSRGESICFISKDFKLWVDIVRSDENMVTGWPVVKFRPSRFCFKSWFWSIPSFCFHPPIIMSLASNDQNSSVQEYRTMWSSFLLKTSKKTPFSIVLVNLIGIHLWFSCQGIFATHQ